MMLKKLNSLPRRCRWPIKWAAVGLTYFLVCYPYPRLFSRHVQHWRNPNALIEPQAPGLQPLVAELREGLADPSDPQQTMKAVERFVKARIPYAFDWETWGVADYLPTVDEVLTMGREDCDGQAVVAASLLQNLGYRAELVTDFMHVWVKTDRGELMGPRPRKALVATDRGVQVNWGWRLIAEFSDAMAYGIGVFPAGRQVIVLLAVWLALIGPRTGWRTVLVGGLLLFAGLLVMREGGRDWRTPIRWVQWVGFAQLVAGVTVLVWSGTMVRRTMETETRQ
ncbi:MAG: transglutaminase-like domain-containing protein [Planctomycetota bacterium]